MAADEARLQIPALGARRHRSASRYKCLGVITKDPSPLFQGL
jgi:hypothetical protein